MLHARAGVVCARARGVRADWHWPEAGSKGARWCGQIREMGDDPAAIAETVRLQRAGQLATATRRVVLDVDGALVVLGRCPLPDPPGTFADVRAVLQQHSIEMEPGWSFLRSGAPVSKKQETLWPFVPKGNGGDVVLRGKGGSNPSSPRMVASTRRARSRHGSAGVNGRSSDHG